MQIRIHLPNNYELFWGSTCMQLYKVFWRQPETLFFYVPFKKGEDTHLINCIVQSVYLGNGLEILPL